MGAHYREGMRARSNAEFISKLEGSLQELEESKYWMEIIVEANIFPAERMDELMREADELTAVIITCVKNVKKRK